MHVAVLGATGVIGRHLVPLLTGRGHRVRAIVRDPSKAGELASGGADIATGDILDPATLVPAFAGCEAVVNAASAVPRPGGDTGWQTNTRIRTEGTSNVIDAAQAAGVGRIIHQSVAMVHRSENGAWVDETSPLSPTPQTQSAVDLETIACSGGIDWQIVRGGLFYGPGTGREDYYREAARTGTLAIPGDGSDYLSPLHIADMAGAIAHILEHAPANSAWLAVDDRPLTWRDFIVRVCVDAGVTLPERFADNPLPSFRCRNARLRALGWSPRYPAFAPDASAASQSR
ncbi:MAG: NAD(P)H-binding protein [Alphaproteobacteria bacterium]